LDDAAAIARAFQIEHVPMQQEIKYIVKVYTGEPDPVLTLTTYGGWNVEGVFLCVYEGGLKKGFRIPPGCHLIETVEAKADPLTDPIDIDPETEAIISRLAEPIDDQQWAQDQANEDMVASNDQEEKDGPTTSGE
jgi:hypothetical protein